MLPALSRRHLHSRQTVREAVNKIRECLSRNPIPPLVSDIPVSARNDAKVLVANALQPRLVLSSDVVFHGARKLTDHEAEQLNRSVERRVAGEPVAYIIGWKEFWSMEFAVTRDTLIPRSDSEVLLETLVAQYHPQTPLHILDIGTGSGCLLLSALSEFPKATGVGIDISPGALDVARKNARSHKLDGRAEFLLRDLQTLPELETDDKVMYQRFDVILCNPPYIPHRELHLVGPDVLAYEPHLALFSGGAPSSGDCGMDLDPQGLRMYDFLHKSVGNLFRSHAETALAAEGGPERRKRPENHTKKNCLLMEIGSMGQAQAVQKLFASTADTQSIRSATGDRSPIKFDRFLFDASGKYRGLLFS